MKNYKSYLDRQEISQAAHENLLNLEVGKRSARPWVKYGALAACAALIIGVGAWRLAPAPAQEPEQSANQFVSDYTPLPGEKDVVEPDDLFVVSSPAGGDRLMFPMLPSILYQDITDRPQADVCRAYEPGSFMVDLTKEDIQTIFWGLKAERPKTEEGDLPWALFWDGYTLRGRALYDGQGQLMELTVWGEKDQASFELEMRLGGLPFTCCIDMDREDEISEFNGVQVAGWSKVFGRDGDHYICGSEFMTKNDIGVRFVNRNSSMQSEYVPGGDTDLEKAQTFNVLFIRQALTEDGGLYLDHLLTPTCPQRSRRVTAPTPGTRSFTAVSAIRRGAATTCLSAGAGGMTTWRCASTGTDTTPVIWLTQTTRPATTCGCMRFPGATACPRSTGRR